VRAGIADALGVDSTYVKVDISPVRRLMNELRRLADNLRVDYVVQLPGDAPDHASAISKAESLTLAEWTAAMQRQAQLSFDISYTVTVTSATAPIVLHGDATITTTTTKILGTTNGVWRHECSHFLLLLALLQI